MPHYAENKLDENFLILTQRSRANPAHAFVFPSPCAREAREGRGEGGELRSVQPGENCIVG